MKRLALSVAAFCLAAGSLAAAESTVMHCFAFTPIKEATPAEWDAFYKATDELPKKIKGLRRVWYGKLRRPMANREHGVCMEFADEAAWTAYDPDPAHKAWVAVYEKVRVPGTSTYQIMPMKR